MTSHDVRPDDRETLSALFDGELSGEARLFALRRLGHDPDWRDAAGRWQLIGDAMRRQAPIAAPADFASRVASAAALAGPSMAVVAAKAPVASASTGPATRSAPGRRIRWVGGGALAASIALAAVVASLPSGPAPEPAAPVLASAGTAGPSPSSAPAAPAGIASQAEPQPEATVRGADPAAAPRIAAVAPQRAVASRPERRAVTVRRADRSVSVPAIEDATMLAGASGNPFNLGTDAALTARPWPRAALGAPAGAFTARYAGAGDSADERPSFYPFEPRLQGEPEQVPTP